jgi:Type II CAAX prenyl endopeptidase Rce1-like
MGSSFGYSEGWYLHDTPVELPAWCHHGLCQPSYADLIRTHIRLMRMGWQQTGLSLGAILLSMAQRSLIHTAIVINEELVFRGYGLDTLRVAAGLPGAVAISTALFAVYHGLEPRQLLNTGVAGILLTVLRLGSGKLWLGAGCHFGWNSMQTAVFGPTSGPPSLRPLHLHGPEAWIGRPGTAEPGWLSILIPAVLALGALGYFWRKGRIPQRN